MRRYPVLFDQRSSSPRLKKNLPEFFFLAHRAFHSLSSSDCQFPSLDLKVGQKKRSTPSPSLRKFPPFCNKVLVFSKRSRSCFRSKGRSTPEEKRVWSRKRTPRTLVVLIDGNEDTFEVDGEGPGLDRTNCRSLSNVRNLWEIC